MKILVTAGNTQVPIDRVRCITSIFSGRTGAGLALHAYERGHQVTLLTSHPEVVREQPRPPRDEQRWKCLVYQTFDQLASLMERQIGNLPHDVVIASAAVSDYQPAGIYAPGPGSHFSAADGTWNAGGPAAFEDRSAGKVKSDEPELWLRLVRTPKLIDRVRTDWEFNGLLVKFKLEVGLSREQLVEVAEKSRQHSRADWMVANLFDGTLSSFFLGPLIPSSPAAGGEGGVRGGYECVGRKDLPARLFDLLEAQHRERTHG